MCENILYIMVGLPYSGKTTLAKELSKRFDLKVVSVDEILAKKNVWISGHPTQNEWESAYFEAIEKIKNYLICGKNIIFDESNLRYDQRENLRKIAENLGTKIVLVYLKISKDEATQRWKNNLVTKVKKQLNREIFERTFEIFEEPKTEEKPIVYNQEKKINVWIKKNF